MLQRIKVFSVHQSLDGSIDSENQVDSVSDPDGKRQQGTLSISKTEKIGSQSMKDVISCLVYSPEGDFLVSFYNFTNRFIVLY